MSRHFSIRIPTLEELYTQPSSGRTLEEIINDDLIILREVLLICRRILAEERNCPQWIMDATPPPDDLQRRQALLLMGRFPLYPAKKYREVFAKWRQWEARIISDGKDLRKHLKS